MISTASRTTASFSEEKKRKTGLRCQLGREVEEVAMGDGHFPREVRRVQRESSQQLATSLRRVRFFHGVFKGRRSPARRPNAGGLESAVPWPVATPPERIRYPLLSKAARKPCR